MKTFKTPIENVLFSASSIGKLMIGMQNIGLSESQKITKLDYEKRLTTPKGLDEKQTDKLKELNAELKEKSSLNATKQKQLDRYNELISKPQGLTPNQQEELDKLIEKEDEKPSLSVGAKTYIKQVWLKNEKGYVTDVQTKQTKKGKQAENDTIALLSDVDNVMYIKNEKRITKGNLTGECDVNHYHKPIEQKIIDDAKSSWSPVTFMAAEFTSLYEWQGRGYMYLYNADIFRLRYCLVDCPPDIYQDEFKRLCYNEGMIDGDGNIFPEYQPLADQFHLNHHYSKTGFYSKEERVKTFAIERDLEKEKLMLDAIELAKDYYKTITLNMI